MSNLLENCSICLSSNAILIKISATDINQIKWSSKLSLCVPEVDWGDSCCICPNCIEQLETAYIFYHLCLQSYEVRKQQTFLVKTEPPPLESKEISEFIANDLNEDETRSCSFGSNNELQGKNHLEKYAQEIPDIENISVHEIDEKCIELIEDPLKIEELPNNDEENRRKEIFKNLPKSKYPKKCDYCSKYFNRKQHIDTHVRRYHTLEKPYPCEQCQARFTTSYDLKVHKNRHANKRPFICSSCGKAFSTSSCLYHHTQIHQNKRQYTCNMCDKSFNTTSILRAHKVCVHTDSKLWKYPCTFCEKRFPMKSGLTTHLRRHTGEKNFACHICGKRFADKVMVTKHFRSHTNERGFKCHLCAKEYKGSEALNVHLKRDHDVGTARIPKPPPKKFVCHLCPKGFVTGTKLEKHVRSHTGERPFVCDVCKKQFADGWYLKMHLKIKHRQDGVGGNSPELFE